MTTWQRIAVAAIIVGAVLTLFLGRYELVPAGSAPGAFRLDRWTGSVWLFYASGAREIKPESPE